MRKRTRKIEIEKVIPDKFKSITFVLTIAFVVVLDQAVKLFASFAGVRAVCNAKFAFGLGTEYTFLTILLSLLSLTTIAIILIFRAKSTFTKLGLVLIIGGGISNLIDRFFGGGCVMDIFHISFFPSFNVADSAITIGVTIIIATMLFGKKVK